MTSAFTNSATCCGQGMSVAKFEVGCCSDPKRMKPQSCAASLRMCADGSVCTGRRGGDALPCGGYGTVKPGNFLNYAQENFNTRRYVAPISGCPQPCFNGSCDNANEGLSAGRPCESPSNSVVPLRADCCPADTRGGSCQCGSTMAQLVETENSLYFDPAYTVTPGMDFLQQYM